MTEAIDIVVDEGMSVPGHMQSSRDVETNSARQFTSSKVNVRTEKILQSGRLWHLQGILDGKKL